MGKTCCQTFRSLPLIVVLIILYNFSYLYDTLSIGVPFTRITWGSFETINVLGQFSTAVVGLTLVQSAYTAEIIRGGFLGVDHGQYEAAAALGLPDDPKTLNAYADRWRPWRSYAVIRLWRAA